MYAGECDVVATTSPVELPGTAVRKQAAQNAARAFFDRCAAKRSKVSNLVTADTNTTVIH